ncbi:MAG: hypothetical protein R3F29_09405 [Planctomycetota bacterium]
MVPPRGDRDATPKFEEDLPAEQLQQIVPLEPDSTFHVVLPTADTRFVAVDLAFGVVLHYVDKAGVEPLR